MTEWYLMQVGDVLYMPRGTIHQAVAQEGASTHLTISTYQNWTYATLAQALLHAGMQGQQEPVCLPLSLRHALPPGFLFSHGFQVRLICLPATLSAGNLAVLGHNPKSLNSVLAIT